MPEPRIMVVKGRHLLWAIAIVGVVLGGGFGGVFWQLARAEGRIWGSMTGLGYDDVARAVDQVLDRREDERKRAARLVPYDQSEAGWRANLQSLVTDTHLAVLALAREHGERDLPATFDRALGSDCR